MKTIIAAVFALFFATATLAQAATPAVHHAKKPVHHKMVKHHKVVKHHAMAKKVAKK